MEPLPTAPPATPLATPPATPPASTALLPALSLRLVKLLEDALPSGVGHTPTVRLTQPRELAHGSAEGITLTLIAVHTLTSVRAAPQRPSAVGAPAAPDVAIEAHYLLTAWANQAALQQWILAAALRQLHQHAVISASQLAHPFVAGADLGVDPDTHYRVATSNLAIEQAAALCTALAAPAMPPSLLVVCGPIVIA